ncbi:hypothetical protein GA0061098_101332 [Bradyrhizobium shewense]|uniref:Uncharacterized protein n=1 Tax=Bradyrhizobium shewense TaxID=1761772 RepID=A0A1C3X814_9BRAD|nr:hypothetical protein [Bradyrhizobium shewense]SCB48403.1 hypothetical protein GA0061098_101332 [Bradyrhizobium shewense]
MTRNQRRQLQKLAERVDRVVESDHRFFERFPDRQYRVRLASQAEIETNAIIEGDKITVAPDRQIYVAVKSVAPRTNLRLIIVGPRDADTDIPEDLAQALYERVNCDKAREIEAQVRLMASGVR